MCKLPDNGLAHFCLLFSFASPIHTLFRPVLGQNGNKMVTIFDKKLKTVTKTVTNKSYNYGKTNFESR